jgi:hypothetical protein
MRNLILWIIAAAVVGCTPPRAPLAPAPAGVEEVTVAEPTNRTGSALVVEDPGLFSKLTGQTRSTVPELVAADLRSALVDRGFRVATARSSGAPTLHVEIRRWEPYSADYSAVSVDLVATLLEPASGRTLWTAERTHWSVPTREARSSIEASTIASQEIATTLLDGWQPARPAK